MMMSVPIPMYMSGLLPFALGKHARAGPASWLYG